MSAVRLKPTLSVVFYQCRLSFIYFAAIPMLASSGEKGHSIMRLRLSVLSIAVLAALSSFALAAGDSGDTPFFNRNDAKNAISRALSVVQKAKCGKEPCAPATTEEFVAPPVDIEEARMAMIMGAKSARLQWCGLEWKDRTYPALLQGFQARGIHDVRVLALLNLIHSEQFGKDYTSLQALKTCPKEEHAALDKQFPEVEIPPWQRVLNNALLDQSVASMLQRVLGEIHKSRCGPEQCAPATDEEKAKPPISIEGARQAMKVGLMSGVAEFCGIDWRKRIFFPYMIHQSRVQKLNERQLAMVSILLGTMQGYMAENYRKHEKECSEKMRTALERQLSTG
jgi:hypothetical protein